MNLEEVSCTVAVETAPTMDIEKIMDESYNLLKGMGSFPDYMENVVSVSEKSDSENSSTIEWDCVIDDAEFNWVQKTYYELSNRLIRFELIEGDFETLEGAWQVSKREESITLRLTLKYAIGLPVIEEVLGPILRKKLESNSYSMLNSIKSILERKYGK
ncbi:MAG: hypothetical protein GY754_38230 [bacterium]|nr:hypothetical protein [bacterium]